MAEEKKPPKLGPKGSNTGASTPSQPSKGSTSSPPKKQPPKLPAKSTSSTPQKQAPKLDKDKTPAKTNGPAKLPPKECAAPSKDSKPAPKLVPKKAGEAPPRKQPAASKPAVGKKEPDQKRPSIAPKEGTSDGKQAARKPSIAPRKSSMKPAEGETRRPSLAPKKSSVQVTKQDAERPKPPTKRPSLAPKKSVQQKAKGGQSGSNDAQENPAHRLNEENRDLKDILCESQCADLTILIANVTERMRQSIEKSFNAKAGLKLINQAKEGEDSFANIDYDPATVDVGAYDKERKVQAEQEKELSKPQVQKLKTDSLDWFDEWRQVVIQRVGEVVNSKKTAETQKDETIPEDSPAEPQQRAQKISATGTTGEYAPPALHDLFPRVRTPLTKLPIAQRVLVIHSILLLLLSLEHYNAASRVLLLYLASSLKVGLNSLRQDEEQTAQGLLEAAKQMTAEQEAGKKKQESAESRKWKIRLASAAGAAIIGYTGGMAAPMVAAGVGSVMGELGLGATAAAGYLGSVAGNTAVVGTLFGAYGGRMTGQIMSNISAEVEDFAFLPVHGERKDVGESLDAANDKRRLRVVVAISGWLLEKEEVVSPWRVLKPSAEVFALRFELEALMNLGQSFDTMLSSAAYGYAQSALAKRTVFSELMSAMWPIALVKVARVVDNPFSLAKNRADKAGEVLAEALMNRAQGERPVTLIGYSLGSRVIWSCLTTLAKKRGFGFVESAVMMGSPIPSDVNSWREMRSVVTGRLVNVYSENDYLLAFLYRSASLSYGVAGLMPVVGLSGIENVDVSEMVSGHLRYRYLVGAILDKIRFEDVDKDEVAKEAKAFEAVVEEEKKNTYEKQVREGAGNLYDEYGQKIGLPKDGKKYISKKDEQDVSDDQANKEASKMEKQVHDKTQKGLMQWAVEQLYITPATPDPKDPKKTIEGAKKTGDAATKSLYERAMEAAYLKRSGGPEGEAAAKDKADKVSKAKESSDKGSYMSSAASYIPSGYLPSFSGSAEKPKAEKPKKLGDQPKRPSTLNKTQSKSRGSTAQLKKTDNAQKAAAPKRPEPAKADSSKKVEAAGKKPQAKPAAGSKPNGKAPSDAKPTAAASKPNEKAPSDAKQPAAANKPNGKASSDKKRPAAGSKPNENAASDAKEAPKSFTQRFTESRDKAAKDASENPQDYVDAGKRGWETAKKGYGAYKDGKKEVDDFTKSAKDFKDTAEGYGSYIPSFGFGGSKEEPKPKEEPKKDTKEDDKDESKDEEKAADAKGSPKKKSQEPKEKPEESSGYTSYIPSFGFGGSSAEKPAEESKDEKPKEDEEKPKEEDEKPREDDEKPKEEDEKPDAKDKSKESKPNADDKAKDEPKESKSKGDDDSKEKPKDNEEPQAKDNPPKKRYPWEVAMDQGEDVDPQKAGDPSKQESSSYNPTSYMPSFGFGGSSDDKAEQTPSKDNDRKPAKSPRGGLMSDSDIYPEDSISSPEKARRRPRSKQPKEKKESIPESTGSGDETPKQTSQDGAKPEEGGKKESDDPSKDGKEEEPKKKYPWEVAMEEGRDVQAEEAAKNSGLSSYMPSFGGGGGGGWGGS